MSVTFAASVHPVEPGRPPMSTAGQRGQLDARLKAVIDGAPIGQIFSNLDGVVTGVNDILAKMLGHEPAEMVGRHVSSFLTEKSYAEVRQHTEAMTGNPADVVCTVRRFLHRDGAEVPVSVTSALLCDNGHPDRWVSLVLDLTEEEQHRVALVSASAIADAARGRLELEHAVAVAANEAGSLEQLAPTMLRLVCDHFGWRAGAIVRSDDAMTDGAPSVQYGFGDCSGLEAELSRSGVVVADGQGVIITIPLDGMSADCSQRLMFDAAGPPEPEHLETLRLVGLQTTQVIERQAIARKLREGEGRFRSVFDSSPLPMAITLGESGTFGVVNDAFCDLVGRSSADLVGKSAAAVLHPEDLHLADPAGAAAAAAPDRRHTELMRFVHASGQVIYSKTTLTWIDGADGRANLLAQFEDITARRAAEDSVRWQASHDMLTGVLNRPQLVIELQKLGAERARAAVLFVDVDSFKLINDTRGHDAGDEVLVGVAARIREVVRPSDFVARFGGDEFVVVCPLEGGNLTMRAAERIENALATAFETTSGPVRVTVSVGVAVGTVDAREPQRLIQQADAAMNQAKHLGKARRIFYDKKLHLHAVERIRTEATLRTALDDGRFVLHLQPIVRLEDSSVVGVEALVRLLDEHGSLVSPGEFMAVAEQSGLIVPMGTWVLQQSCRLIAELREMTGRMLTISVNVAALQAARPDFASTVVEALRAANLPDDALTLELTESALLEAHDQTLAQLNMLRKRGVGIALDDFGTGYSSLTYLRRLPVSCLKVDRSFVQDMMATSSDRAIVRAVVNLAHDLGLQWVAEGVETVEQRLALREFGCGLEQGYLFSRPVPFDELVTLLRD